jgi:hypothetical protein
MTTIRLVLRLHRFEIALFAIVLLALAGVGFAMSVLFDGPSLVPCLTDPTAAGCPDGLARSETLSNFRGIFQLALSGASILFGLILGLGIVAQEVEQGTATLAWTIHPSRIRWLAPRIAFTVLVIVVLVGLPAFAADLFERARQVPAIVGDSVQDYQVRGLPVVARALLAFAIALAVGAWLGRMLPALLLSLALFVVLAGAAEVGLGSWLIGEAQPISDPGALYLREGYRADDGRILESGEAFAILSPEDPAFPAHFESVSLGIPGTRTREAVTRAAVTYLLLSGGLIGATFLVVNRRRPS